jgi:hypothetical protein
MHAIGLHWFRTRQRGFARFALAAFCLTWLQLAAMPCVMAIGAAAATPPAMDASALASMPEDMVMAPGEHCVYCPPEPAAGATIDSSDRCAFPHDPQVDSRAAFASTMLAPPPALVLFVATDHAIDIAESALASAPDPRPRTPLAVSLCRFLK